MRTLIGLGVLAFGLVILGLWGRGDHAVDIETDITAKANEIIGTGRDIDLHVSGRDITVNGFANSDAEKKALVKQLNQASGRRVVNADALEALQTVSPYVFNGTKSEVGVSVTGNTPTRAQRAEFAGTFDTDETVFTMASGMPNAQWPEFVSTGVTALSAFENGSLSITDTTMKLSGQARNPAHQAEIVALLDSIKAPFTVQTDIETLDDGKPVKVAFDYVNGKTATLSGKLPKDLTAEGLTKTINLPNLNTTVANSILDGADTMSVHFNAIAKHLPEFRTLSAQSQPDSLTVSGILLPTADKETVASALTAAAGDADHIKLAQIPARLTPEFRATCLQNIASILESSKINFVIGSANLDTASNDVLDNIANIIKPCVFSGFTELEIGGHTDNSGSDAINVPLSSQRAEAVKAALVERGIAQDTLFAKGFGSSKPIADNTTDEGKAISRRTTFEWIDN